MGLDPATRSCVYHVALLRFLGCTSDASEAVIFAGGDYVAMNAVFAPMLNAQPGEGLRFLVRHLAEDLPLGRRIGRVAAALSDPSGERRSLSAHCEAASLLATRLCMPESVCESLAHAYERWDGKGYPNERGTAISHSRVRELRCRHRSACEGADRAPETMRR
jgi:HD domain